MKGNHNAWLIIRLLNQNFSSSTSTRTTSLQAITTPPRQLFLQHRPWMVLVVVDHKHHISPEDPILVAGNTINWEEDSIQVAQIYRARFKYHVIETKKKENQFAPGTLGRKSQSQGNHGRGGETTSAPSRPTDMNVPSLKIFVITRSFRMQCLFLFRNSPMWSKGQPGFLLCAHFGCR